MNILMTSGIFYPALVYGGPPVSVYNLAKGLVEEGVSVTVFTSNANGSKNLSYPLGEEIIISGIKTFYFDRKFSGTVLGEKLFLSTGIYSALRKNLSEFDLVHIQGIFTYPTAISAYLCRVFNKPHLMALRGGLQPWALGKRSLYKELFIRLVEKRNLRHADAVQFTSEVERDCAPLYARSNPVILPNPIIFAEYSNCQVNNFRQEYGIDKKTILFAFLGRIHAIKGIEVLLSAFRQARSEVPNARLVIAGSGEAAYEKQLKEQVAQMGLEDAVLFPGFLKDQEKISLLQGADIFVLPSYRENFSNAAAEAMAAGLPVIVSDKVNIYPDILSAEAGLAVQCDSTELARAMLQLSASPEKRRTMGIRGQAFVKEHYEVRKVARKAIKIYEAILEKHRN